MLLVRTQRGVVLLCRPTAVGTFNEFQQADCVKAIASVRVLRWVEAQAKLFIAEEHAESDLPWENCIAKRVNEPTKAGRSRQPARGLHWLSSSDAGAKAVSAAERGEEGLCGVGVVAIMNTLEREWKTERTTFDSPKLGEATVPGSHLGESFVWLHITLTETSAQESAMEDVEAPAEPLEPSDTVSAPEQNNVQLYMEGLSRLDRTVDDSGYAFTALDVVVRHSSAVTRVDLDAHEDSQDKQLTSLDAISNYTHLRFVNVSKNQIADLTPLGELPHLVCVDASENALAAPCSLPQAYLQTLDVSQNQIESLQGFQSASLALLKANGMFEYRSFC